ncbi:MAG: fibronectin type III domain-containing protein [candidate division KSB1 bacterium]|jgi:hypothetical protein|nr:fibronectin type III domain-containing protein [candidate division KSB1 bacterium]
MRSKLIAVVLFALLAGGCAQIFRTGPEYEARRREKLKQEALEKVNRCISENISRSHQGPVPRATRVDSINIDFEGKDLDIFLSRHFASQPFRQENVGRIQALFGEYIDGRFSDYQFTLYTLEQPLSNLIPNYFRADSASYDGSRMPDVTTRDTQPLVRNIDKSAWRPEKGLGNYNIALWHSHGFYYSHDTDRWEWQRPRLFSTVEDLLPMSFVIPYIVPMLENAGANVFLPRERDLQTNEIIVDNDPIPGMSRYAESDAAQWRTGEESGFAIGTPPYEANVNPFHQGSYRECTSDTRTTTQAKWIPRIPETGEYGVTISFHASPDNVQDACYTVMHSGGETRFLINQQIGGGTWIYLGTFHFEKEASPDSASVVLSNKSSTPGKKVSADAVRFGGGMGNILRGGRVSGYPRFAEGARYYLQYAGMPDTLVYHLNEDTTDYNDDYQSRGEWVNYLKGAPFGPNRDRETPGLGIPIDLSLSFHTDAGIDTADSTIGTLMIYSISDAETLSVFPDSMSRLANRDLADVVQTQITDDIKSKYRADWTRRDLRNAGYSEVWRPNVPSILLELLSHQNFEDMKYALSPSFRFDVSRSIYKGMLRFLSRQYHFDYIVQPLPVSHLCAEYAGDDGIRLRWRPVPDPLEPAALPDRYVVYTRVDDNGFDNGTLVTQPEYRIDDLPKGEIYSFKITAVNDGGESLPSEVISVCRINNDKPAVLIVNGFDRISPPDFVAADDYKGFSTMSDPGVADRYTFNFTGSQFDFNMNSPYRTNDAPGHGASFANRETRIISGNTFDNAFIHGRSIAAAGYSFVSCSDEAVMDSMLDLKDYTIVDLILGEEKTTLFPDYAGNHTAFEKQTERFRAFPDKMRDQLTNFCANQGNLFVSGAYVATDLLGRADVSEADSLFAADVLRIGWETDHAAVNGMVFSVDSLLLPRFTHLIYNVNYSDSLYSVESPDAIAAVNGARTILRYSENRFSAATAYLNDYKAIVFGFPFETIVSREMRDRLMYRVLKMFSDERKN